MFYGVKIKNFEGLYWLNENGEVYSGYCGRTLKCMYDQFGRAYVSLFKNGVYENHYIDNLLSEHFPAHVDGKSFMFYNGYLDALSMLKPMTQSTRKCIVDATGEVLRTASYRYAIGTLLRSVPDIFAKLALATPVRIFQDTKPRTASRRIKFAVDKLLAQTDLVETKPEFIDRMSRSQGLPTPEPVDTSEFKPDPYIPF